MQLYIYIYNNQNNCSSFKNKPEEQNPNWYYKIIKIKFKIKASIGSYHPKVEKMNLPNRNGHNWSRQVTTLVDYLCPPKQPERLHENRDNIWNDWPNQTPFPIHQPMMTSTNLIGVDAMLPWHINIEKFN